jgi:long-chain acyl-CoA synthetase
MFLLTLACIEEGAIIIPVAATAGQGWINDLTMATSPVALASSPGYITPTSLSRSRSGLPPDVHTLIMTSGTTGAPKGVPIHAAMSDAACENAIEALKLGKSTIFLNFIPPSTVGGLFLAGLPLFAAGATQVVRAFNPFEFANLIGRFRPTHTILLPVMINILRNLQKWDSVDLSCLDTLVAGASPVSEQAAEAVLERGARRFVHAYGSSECLTPVLIHESFSASARDKTALSTFCGDYHHRLTAEGELLLRGAAVMRGYFGGASEAGFVDGWFRTGDLFVEKDSNLWFVGRVDERLKINGFRVSPEVTEKLIVDVPGITNCAVVKVVERSGGESLTAVISGRVEPDMDVIGYCRSRLAPTQVPRLVKLVQRVPGYGLGKVDRRAAAAGMDS